MLWPLYAAQTKRLKDHDHFMFPLDMEDRAAEILLLRRTKRMVTTRR